MPEPLPLLDRLQALTAIGRADASLQEQIEVWCAVPLLIQACHALATATELLEDCWQQFSYDGKAGGLSTLEWLEEELPRLRAALAPLTGSGDSA